MVHNSHTSEHLMSISCTKWCTIITPLNTLWVHQAQYGAQFSHLWAPYEYIMHNMVQNCHTSEHPMSTSCCRILIPLSTLWVHHAQYGAEFSTIIDATQRTKKQTKAVDVSEIIKLRLQYICKLRLLFCVWLVYWPEINMQTGTNLISLH